MNINGKFINTNWLKQNYSIPADFHPSALSVIGVPFSTVIEYCVHKSGIDIVAIQI